LSNINDDRLRDSSLAPINSPDIQQDQAIQFDPIEPEDAGVNLPSINSQTEESLPGSSEFWDNITNGGDYSDSNEEDVENSMNKLKLNSILFAVFQTLLVLIFVRAVNSIDHGRFGYEYLKKLGIAQ